MPQSMIRNKNLRNQVTVIEERPNLSEFGVAGARLRMDLLLTRHHGIPPSEQVKLSAEERHVLCLIAREEDPAWGVSHQVDAIGLLGQLRDQEALLQLSDLARSNQADLRLRIAAINALGEIGGEPVQAVLQPLLQDKTPEVRAEAVKAVAQNGSTADILALEMLVQEDKTFVAEVARQAVRALRTKLQVDER